MNRKRKHIAIVEDDDSIRELLAENLKRAGYQVSAFFSAEQFERKSDAGFNLLLLDIMLPGKKRSGASERSKSIKPHASGHSAHRV